MTTSKVPCTWCLNSHRSAWVPAGHVILFVCVREHMRAQPMCEDCATSSEATVGAAFYCIDCIDALVPRTDNGPLCYIDLITTREDWMERIQEGRIRMLNRGVSA